MVIANDSAIRGGTISPMGLKKSLRAQEIALENRLPLINLVDERRRESGLSGGDLRGRGPRVRQSGAPLRRGDSSDYGGARVVDSRGSLSPGPVGLRDCRARQGPYLPGRPAPGQGGNRGGRHGRRARRGTNARRGVGHGGIPGRQRCPRDSNRPRPGHHARLGEEPNAACGRASTPASIPTSYSESCPWTSAIPYDAHEVLARVVDDSEFLDFKAGFGASTVCGHARVEGMPCAFIANNGPIDPEGASKAAHFIQACCQASIPIAYLHNTTGYMVGKEAEQRGIVKHGSKMIQAVANATVPQVAILIGGSFGAGNYGMCGRSFDPRFAFAWPNSRIAVMGPDQASRVMDLVTRAKHARTGVPLDEASLEMMTAGLRAKLDQESSALYATARLWDDGIIDPRDTRRVLAFALGVFREAQHRRPASEHIRSGAHVRREGGMKLTPEHLQIRAAARKFIDREINPYADRWEQEEIFPAHDLFKKLGQQGFLGINRPTQYGGMGLDFSYSTVLAEELGRCHSGGVAMAIGVHTDMCTPALAKFGSDDLRPGIPRTLDCGRPRRVCGDQRTRSGLRRGCRKDLRPQGGRGLRAAGHQDVDHQRPAGRLDVLPGEYLRGPAAPEQVALDCPSRCEGNRAHQDSQDRDVGVGHRAGVL